MQFAATPMTENIPNQDLLLQGCIWRQVMVLNDGLSSPEAPKGIYGEKNVLYL